MNDRDTQIVETNQRLLNCCVEIIRKLTQDPEAHVHDAVDHMLKESNSRRIQIRMKYQEQRNACDRYERKEPENALA